MDVVSSDKTVFYFEVRSGKKFKQKKFVWYYSLLQKHSSLNHRSCDTGCLLIASSLSLDTFIFADPAHASQIILLNWSRYRPLSFIAWWTVSLWAGNRTNQSSDTTWKDLSLSLFGKKFLQNLSFELCWYFLSSFTELYLVFRLKDLTWSEA